jgi:hypothetical protein
VFEQKIFLPRDARQFIDSQGIQIIDAMVDEIAVARRGGQRPLVILDLDSTLVDTAYRTANIFHNWALQPSHQDRHGDLCQKILQWQVITEVYNPVDFVAHHSSDPIERSSDLGRQLMRWWGERFFLGEWLLFDRPYAHAVESVYVFLDAGADIAYLTGREGKTLKQGTLDFFKTFKFPHNTKHARLMMKASKAIRDHHYKCTGLSLLSKDYDPVWYIENEVELLLMCADKHKRIVPIMFDSVHSERAMLGDIRFPSLKSWYRG